MFVSTCLGALLAMSIAWTRGRYFTFLGDHLLDGCIVNANWKQETMNQYAYIFTLFGRLQSLSVTVPRKLLCQSFYHICSVLSDEKTNQSKSNLSRKCLKKEQTMQEDKNETSREGLWQRSQFNVTVIFILTILLLIYISTMDFFTFSLMFASSSVFIKCLWTLPPHTAVALSHWVNISTVIQVLYFKVLYMSWTISCYFILIMHFISTTGKYCPLNCTERLLDSCSY